MQSKQVPTKPRIVILGGGTGGTLTANRLRKALAGRRRSPWSTPNDRHVYQPGLLFVPFGLARPRRHRPATVSSSCIAASTYHQSGIDHVDIDGRARCTSPDGTALDYDVLVVATGSRLVPEETEGLTGPGWMEQVFTFYDLDGAAALAAGARPVRGWPARGQRGRHAHQVPGGAARVLLPGRLVLPRARHPRPGRAHLCHARSTARSPSRRRRRTLGGMLEERGIELVTEFNTGEVDGDGGRLDRLRRARGALRPGRGRPGPQRRRLRRTLTRAGRRPRLRRPPTSTRCSPRRRRTIFAIGDAANLPASEGRVGHPLRGRGPGREHPALPRRRAARRHLRRPRQLLHRDRLPQGHAHRLQLRDRAGRRALPRRGRRAAAQGVPPQPPRQADVPVVLLARPAARPRHPRRSPPTCRSPARTSAWPT